MKCLKYVLVIAVVCGISSCVFVSPTSERSKSLTKSQIVAAIKAKMPEGFVVKSGGADDKAAKYCIRLVDTKSPHFMRWEDSSGKRGVLKTGFEAIEFWVSTMGDTRAKFWLIPDRGKLFYSRGSTYIYAIESSVYSSGSIEKKADAIVEDARWVSGLEGEIDWPSWRKDIIASLEQL